ncbi:MULTISPECIES: GDSL-type esterase/lipase family protein [Clostridium]|jgi:lysophospholipase L1-like esterase|uniref:GDSL-type esterase/lipase family protein n=1 Tax=Clostridium TaxID=1485 RepID=UPI00028996EB|nr:MULTISPECIES: GDSL-type esterase/lipase family protein [Clostridium]MDF2502881.1 lysophospholipase L1-like esterase [Clostridium sp.]
MKIVCIGDSLTYGYGVYSDECWVKLLHKSLNIEIINKGVNGDTTAGILSRSHKDILELKPSHVILMAGTNDILLNYPVNNIIDNIKFLLKEIKDNNITPILALQPPIIGELAEIYWDKYISYSKANEHLFEYIRKINSFACENNINIINFYDSFIKIKDIVNLYSDGIHPNSEGHKLMIQTVIQSNISGIYQ